MSTSRDWDKNRKYLSGHLKRKHTEKKQKQELENRQKESLLKLLKTDNELSSKEIENLELAAASPSATSFETYFVQEQFSELLNNIILFTLVSYDLYFFSFLFM